MELMLVPSELLVEVLILLDFQDLLCCREVCIRFKTLIDEDVRTQYKIELAIAGMDDGPPSALTTADRLSILRTRQDAWSKFAWTAKVVIPMHQNGFCRLLDNVFAQLEANGMLRLKRIPSGIRGIAGTEWVIPGLGRMITDIGMDSAQDLLVIVERFWDPGALLLTHRIRIHLRALSTGEPHPAGPRAAMLVHQSTPRACFYRTQTSANYLGIHLSLNGQDDEELLVWDWKIGTLRLHITGLAISSWAFLTPRFILISQTAPEFDDENRRTIYRPHLVVVDLHNSPSSDPLAFSELNYVCAFHYPPLAEGLEVSDMAIQPESGPNACPAHGVPFSLSSVHRLLLITLWVLVPNDEEMALRSLVPVSTFLRPALVTLATGETGRAFAWAEWGPRGSRLMRISRAGAWATSEGECRVYGTVFATVEVDSDVQAQDGDARMILLVRDFNQRAIRHRQWMEGGAGDKDPVGENSGEQDWNGRLVADATVFEPAGVFREEVRTALPYVERRFLLSQEEMGEGTQLYAVKLAEDALVMMMRNRDSQLQCRILSF